LINGIDSKSTFIFQGGETRKIKGVVSSFQLVPENSGGWSFLQVGDYKSRGHSLLLIGSRELRELVLPSGWCM
jgi:hypothetical protein